MQELFSGEFFKNQHKELFTILKVEDNLFQARSASEVIILWKVNNVWEGAGISTPKDLISNIGANIDNYYSKIAR